ncbi:hypothetical protein [Frankia sp. AgW1.1]|uniref:hypothetical protein n=1 Tax=Frankia sp. AgW1.1 TaxID=1836971 RepID=UPI0019316BEF|nr:hypothetical protein [Frankia sp. AgW1.1]MBL7487155.1 hypothetical protein [Frankia sp. AgW1.1]
MTAPTAAPDIRAVDDPPGVDNPYWQQVRQIPDWGQSWDCCSTSPPRRSRDDFVYHHSWAIPDPLSVKFVADNCPNGAVEIGAGSGYWAWQLAQRGVPVAAFDEAPPNIAENCWCQDGTLPAADRLRRLFYPVVEGNTRNAKAFPNRALFLCWPPNKTPMAAAALDFYPGNRLIYIGDNDCCADEDFFTALAQDWVEVATHRPVQWGGMSDWITVYDRKAST